MKANPGLRVPGAFNGFEMGVRAILGQQVTVKAATTIACRFVEAFGEPIVTPFAELNRLTPAPARVAAASVDDIARHGIVAARARSIIALAAAQRSGALCLDGGAHHNPDDSIKRLAELPGIGQWTAHYIAMRALRWPDAFPKEDIAVRNNLGGVTAKEAEVAVAGLAALAQLRRHARLESVGASFVSSRSERLEILAIERGEFRRRLMEFLQQLGPRTVSLAGQDYELHAAIVQHDLPFGEAERLQPVHDPCRIRGVAFPFVGEGAHRATGPGVQAEQGARIVGCQPAPCQAPGARRR